jgi:hypothetical protein
MPIKFNPNWFNTNTQSLGVVLLICFNVLFWQNKNTQRIGHPVLNHFRSSSHKSLSAEQTQELSRMLIQKTVSGWPWAAARHIRLSRQPAWRHGPYVGSPQGLGLSWHPTNQNLQNSSRAKSPSKWAKEDKPSGHHFYIAKDVAVCWT